MHSRLVQLSLEYFTIVLFLNNPKASAITARQRTRTLGNTAAELLGFSKYLAVATQFVLVWSSIIIPGLSSHVLNPKRPLGGWLLFVFDESYCAVSNSSAISRSWRPLGVMSKMSSRWQASSLIVPASPVIPLHNIRSMFVDVCCDVWLCRH